MRLLYYSNLKIANTNRPLYVKNNASQQKQDACLTLIAWVSQPWRHTFTYHNALVRGKTQTEFSDFPPKLIFNLSKLFFCYIECLLVFYVVIFALGVYTFQICELRNACVSTIFSFIQICVVLPELIILQSYSLPFICASIWGEQGNKNKNE